MSAIKHNVPVSTLEIRGRGRLRIDTDCKLSSSEEISFVETKDSLIVMVGCEEPNRDKRSRRSSESQRNVVSGSIISGGSIHVGDSVIIQNGATTAQQRSRGSHNEHQLVFAIPVRTISIYGYGELNPEDSDRLDVTIEHPTFLSNRSLNITVNHARFFAYGNIQKVKNLTLVGMHSRVMFGGDVNPDEAIISLVETHMSNFACNRLYLTALRNSSVAIRTRFAALNCVDESSEPKCNVTLERGE